MVGAFIDRFDLATRIHSYRINRFDLATRKLRLKCQGLVLYGKVTNGARMRMPGREHGREKKRRAEIGLHIVWEC